MADFRDPTCDPRVAPTALILVHLQHGFADESGDVEPLARRIASHARAHEGEYRLVVAARFVSTPEGPYARFIDDSMQSDAEQALLPEIAELPGLVTFDGEGYSALTPELLTCLREAGVERAHVAGIDTDQCVLATALALFDAGIEPVALADLCLSTSGQTPHEAGMVALRRALNEERVVE